MLISFLISMLKVCAAIDDSRAFKSCVVLQHIGLVYDKLCS